MIETERLYLREMTDRDFHMLSMVLGDSDIMQHYPYSFDEARVRQWISVNVERYRVFGFGLWAVEIKEGKEVIGDCGLTMQNINGVIRPEIGYHVRKDKQRMGYGKEAARAVRNWAFQNTPFNVLYSYMRAENRGSWATAMSIGMKKIDEYVDRDNQVIFVYAIGREEWEKICTKEC